MGAWRTATHWYRPIRVTDARRFIADMDAGWRRCGAIPPPTMAEREATLLAVYDAARRALDPTNIRRHLPRR